MVVALFSHCLDTNAQEIGNVRNPSAHEIGDGGLATDAQISGPTSLAIDKENNLYIVEAAGNRIRRVDAKTKIITTIAGNGDECLGRDCVFADGAIATDLALGAPNDIAVDVQENIFFTQITGEILKVSAGTERIHTVIAQASQCPAATSRAMCLDEFEDPNGLVIDDHGDLFFTVRRNTVYKIVVSAGELRRIAGVGFGFSGDGGSALDARLSFPMGIVIDSRGNVVFADYQNCRIRRIDASSGLITTIAGTGEEGSTGDGGPATAASVDYPDRIAIDSAGDIFLEEGGKGKVRRIDAKTGLITTVAGIGIQGFSGDLGPAVNAKIHNPSGVAVDSEGNLYISDYVSNRVRRVEFKTGIISTFAGNGLPMRVIEGIL